MMAEFTYLIEKHERDCPKFCSALNDAILNRWNFPELAKGINFLEKEDLSIFTEIMTKKILNKLN